MFDGKPLGLFRTAAFVPQVVDARHRCGNGMQRTQTSQLDPSARVVKVSMAKGALARWLLAQSRCVSGNTTDSRYKSKTSR